SRRAPGTGAGAAAPAAGRPAANAPTPGAGFSPGTIRRTPLTRLRVRDERRGTGPVHRRHRVADAGASLRVPRQAAPPPAHQLPSPHGIVARRAFREPQTRGATVARSARTPRPRRFRRWDAVPARDGDRPRGRT